MSFKHLLSDKIYPVSLTKFHSKYTRFKGSCYSLVALLAACPLLASSPREPLDEEHKRLKKHIISTTGAKKDQVSLHYNVLKSCLEDTQDPLLELRRHLSAKEPSSSLFFKIWDHFQLKHLLNPKKFQGDETTYNSLLQELILTEDHEGFSPLKSHMASLERFKGLYSDPLIQRSLKKLINFYENEIKYICTLSSRERQDYLEKDKALLVFEDGSFYRLNRPMAHYLMSKNEFSMSERSINEGCHLVRAYEGVHYKADGDNPLTPSFERLATLIDRGFFPQTSETLHEGKGTAPSLFCAFLNSGLKEITCLLGHDETFIQLVKEGKNPRPYLREHPELQIGITENNTPLYLQASQSMDGQQLLKYMETISPQGSRLFDSEKFDLEHYGHQLIFSLLSRPYDAKSDNFILIDSSQGHRFIGIDNDAILSPLLFKIGPSHDQKYFPGHRNILYAIHELRNALIPESLCQSLQALPISQPWKVLENILKTRLRYEYARSFMIIEPKAFETYELSLLLPPEMFTTLLDTWKACQEALKNPKTHQFADLIHAVDPVSGSIYKALIEKYGPHPQRIISSLYTEEDTLDDLLSHSSDHIQNRVQALYEEAPQKDDRRGQRLTSFKKAFRGGWSYGSLKEYTLEDCIHVFNTLPLLKKVMALEAPRILMKEVVSHVNNVLIVAKSISAFINPHYTFDRKDLTVETLTKHKSVLERLKEVSPEPVQALLEAIITFMESEAYLRENAWNAFYETVRQNDRFTAWSAFERDISFLETLRSNTTFNALCQREFKSFFKERKNMFLLVEPLSQNQSFETLFSLLENKQHARVKKNIAHLEHEAFLKTWHLYTKDLKAHWPPGPIWNAENLLFDLISHPLSTPQTIATWIEAFLSHVAGKNQQGDTLLHGLFRRFQGEELNLFNFHPFVGVLNERNQGGETPLDILLTSKTQPSTQLIQHLVELGAYRVHYPNVLARYCRERGMNDTTLAPWVQTLMHRVPTLTWHLMLEDLLPLASSDYEGTPIQTMGEDRILLHSLETQHLFFDNGRFKKKNKEGVRSLGHIPWRQSQPCEDAYERRGSGLWIKLFPELAGREETVRHLVLDHMTRDLIGYPIVPPSLLIKIPCIGKWKIFKNVMRLSCISALVSQSLGDTNLKKAYEEDPTIYKKLDHESVSWLFVLSLLLNPEDGQPANHAVTEHPLKPGVFILSSIDNDRIMVPSIAYEKQGCNKKEVVQVKSILYCLDEMKEPLHPHVVEALRKVKGSDFFPAWLKGLVTYAEGMGHLFNRQERVALESLKDHPSHIFLPFIKEEAVRIYERYIRLQDALNEASTSKQTLTCLDLLKTVDRLLAKRYEAVLTQPLDPSARFAEVEGPYYDFDRRTGSWVTSQTGYQTLKAQHDKIKTKKAFFQYVEDDEDITPKAALEELNAYIEEESDIRALIGSPEESFTGTHAPSLERYLEAHAWGDITAPVQRHLLQHMLSKSFETLFLHYCKHMRWEDFRTFHVENLRYLDVSDCGFVDDALITKLSTESATLTYLDVSGTAITGLWEKGLVTTQPFKAPHLETFKAKNCPQFKGWKLATPALTLMETPLLSFDGTGLTGSTQATGHKVIKPYYLKQLLTVNAFTNIQAFKAKDCSFNSSHAKPLSSLTNLTTLNLPVNEIGSKGVQHLKGLTQLTTLNLHGNKIGSQGAQYISELTQLTTLSLGLNEIGPKGVQYLSGLTNLTTLNLYWNNIGSQGAQYLKGLTQLTTLNLGENEIGPEGVQHLEGLTQLTTLDLRRNNIGPEAQKNFKRVLPRCRINF